MFSAIHMIKILMSKPYRGVIMFLSLVFMAAFIAGSMSEEGHKITTNPVADSLAFIFTPYGIIQLTAFFGFLTILVVASDRQ